MKVSEHLWKFLLNISCALYNEHATSYHAAIKFETNMKMHVERTRDLHFILREYAITFSSQETNNLLS